VFVGCLPIYGLQFGALLAVCVPLRLDMAVAYVAAHISNPITLVPLLALEIAVGALVLTGHAEVPNLTEMKHGIVKVGAQAALGSIVVGLVFSSVAAGVAWTLGRRVRDARRGELTRGRQRTLDRYRDVPAAARHYVSSKLKLDPAVSDIASLAGAFGRVVDGGCGYGHVGLALTDLGRVTSLHGFDADPSRVSVAKRVAPEAHFDVARLEEAPFPDADTVLLVDSLHYLPLATQDAILERAARALAPGGRLIVREVDVSRSLQSRLTQWSERRAVKRVNPTGEAGFRSKKQLVDVFDALGLTSAVVVNEDFSIFENVLVVGTKPAPANAAADSPIDDADTLGA